MKKTISLLLIVTTLTSYATTNHAPSATKGNNLYGMHHSHVYVADTGGVYDRI